MPRAAKLEVINPEPKVVALPLPRETLASVEPSTQRRRDGDRRKILEDELKNEEQSLTTVRASLVEERANPTLVAAVRAMQQADNPTPTQMAELRGNVDKASGRIRGLQATAAEHEKNIEAIKKELGALKP
jgi:septal ring factor EnvC (AmiA/AmiB activator)